MSNFSFLDKSHVVAKPGHSRWLVPPAALAIHLSIGQAYAFSVFVNPLHALHGADGSSWDLKAIGYIFSIAIGVLGLSAALFSKWLETAGPRKVLFVGAICFALGFLISAAGVQLHQIALLYLGYGVVGGVGLGLAYISPVATLIRWFPDKPGLATGLAIMGFGGGAMIGAPMANKLMAAYAGSSYQPIALTMATMGVFYFVFMMFGVFLIRAPRPGWKPAGWSPQSAAAHDSSHIVSTHQVSANNAMKTPQFWMIWFMLALNTTAGIGILESASPMIQNLFLGKVSAAAAGGFVGVLSLFNMGGRFVWSSSSDKLGRKLTFMLFFIIGAVLFFFLPTFHSIPVFVLAAGVLISMYGGGFSTAPAYLKDLYGSAEVSAIYGRLLTAWSTAAIIGPLIVNGLLDKAKAAGQPLSSAYPLVLHIMSGLLVIGLVLSFLVRPVSERFWAKPGELADNGDFAH